MKARTAPRQQRHEAQAERTARRITGGGRAPQGWMSPRPAASLPSWLGSGQPLQTPLRQRLEGAFGADLGALRVHVGEGAGRWLSTLGTQGAAGGHHIAIAPAAWHPGTSCGLRLLAHEVAHTLQQAGVHLPDGRLRLVPRNGTGAPQGDPATRAELLDLPSQTILDHIRAVHEAADPSLAAAMTTWWPDFTRQLLAEPTLEARTTFIAADRETRLAALRDKPLELAVWADVARLLDTPSAIRAVQARPEIRTILPSQAVLNGLVAEATDAVFWSRSLHASTAHRYATEGLRAVLDAYLWSIPPEDGSQASYPRLSRAVGGGNRGPAQDLEQFNRTDGDPRVLKMSEWGIAGLMAMVSVDDQLASRLLRIDRRATGGLDENTGEIYTNNNLLVMHERAAHLHALGEHASAATPTGDLGPLWWAWRAIGPEIVARTEVARNFWRQAIDRQVARSDSIVTTGAAGGPDDYAVTALALPAFAAGIDPLATAALPGLRALFAVPATADRDARWTGFPGQVETFIASWDAVMVRPAVAAALAARSAGDEPLAMAWSWFATWAGTLHRLVQHASPSNAVLDHEQYLPDLALHWRWNAARFVDDFARQAGPVAAAWQPVGLLVARIDLEATDLRTSELAIPGEFTPDDTAEPRVLAQDIRNLDGNAAPLSANDLVNFFSEIRLRALAEAVQARLAARAAPGATPGVGSLGLFADAQETLDDQATRALLPRRWLARDVQWWPWPGDPPGTYRRLLEAHPRTMDIAVPAGRLTVYPGGFAPAHDQPAGTIAVWTIPPPNALVQRLRQITWLNRVVALSLAQPELFAPPNDAPPETVRTWSEAARTTMFADWSGDLAPARRLDDLAWWNRLRSIRGIFDDARDAATPAIEANRTAYRDRATEVIGLEREATNSDRAIVRAEILRLLDGFSGSVGDLHLLTRTQSLLTTFETIARPAVTLAGSPMSGREWLAREQRLQVSALVLECADALAGAAEETRQFSNRRDLFPFLSHAIADAEAVAARDDIIVGPEPLRRVLVTTARARLERARTTMLAELGGMQERFRIQGRAGTNSLTSALFPHRDIRAGEARHDAEGNLDTSGPPGVFRIDGLYIRIDDVAEDFTFFPRMGSHPAPGEEEHTYQRGSRLVLGLVDGAAEGTPHVPDPDHPRLLALVSVGMAEDHLVEVRITDQDLDDTRSGMAWLAHVTAMQSAVMSLENTRQLTQDFGEGVMFIMSFTPLGWAVEVTQMLAMIGEAFSDDPHSVLTQIRDLISEPDEAFRRLLAAVTEHLTPQALLEGFLLGGDRFRALATLMGNRRSAPSSASPAVRRGVAGALARVRRLGSAVGTRLTRVQNRVQPPVRAMRAGILSRPLISSMVHWAADHWSLLGDRNPFEAAILQHPVAGPIYEIAVLVRERAAAAGIDSVEDLRAAVGDLGDRARQLVEDLRSLELPEQIVPLEAMNAILVDAFLFFISRRGSARVKAAARVAIAGADVIGARQMLAEALAARMRDTRFDPNTYWRDLVVPEIRTPFATAVTTLADGLDHAFAHIPFLDYAVQDIPRPEVAVTTSSAADADFDSPEAVTFDLGPGATGANADPAGTPPEAAGASPWRLPGYAPRPAPPATIATSGGRPLPTDLRRRWEDGFGHDLGHVRLHQGDDAGRLTASHGAAALTSGSRIFLGAGLSPSHGQGERILGHELAHVLQKTGPRQPGASGAVVAGRGGLRQHPGEERAADRMAAAARQGGDGPVPILGAHADGASPSLAEVVPGFLKSISNMRAVTTTLHDVSTAMTAAAGSGLDEEVGRTANAIWRLISPKLQNAASQCGWARFIPSADRVVVAGFLATRLGDRAPIEDTGGPTPGGTRRAGAITAAVEILARRAQREIPQPAATTGTAPAAATPTRYELAIHTFVNELQLYLLGRTGIALDINNVRVTASTRRGAAPTVSIGTIEVEDIVLRWLPEGTEPWDRVVRNTWGTGTTTRERQVAARLIREAVEPPDGSGGSAPRVWDGNEFKFNARFKEQVDAQVRPSSLDASRLPMWDVFVGSSSSAPIDGDDKLPAIRLRTHGSFTDGSWSLEQNDRQSHHTTQYLVPEYFRNGKEFRPFDPARRWPASIQFAGGGLVKNIGRSTPASEPIKVEDTEKTRRGGAMPAILLSSDAHLGSPSLHVTPQADDTGAASQGYAIHRVFSGHLPEPLRPAAATATADAWLAANASSAPEIIWRAVQATYRDIRADMMTKLRDHFPARERAWYDRVAVGDTTDAAERDRRLAAKVGTRTPGQREGELRSIAEGVSTVGSGHNDTVMTVLGWDQRRGS